MPFTEFNGAFKMSHADKCRSLWLSHKFWFRAIYIICMVLFLFAVVIATVQLCTTTTPNDVNDFNTKKTVENADILDSNRRIEKIEGQSSINDWGQYTESVGISGDTIPIIGGKNRSLFWEIEFWELGFKLGQPPIK